MMETYLWDFHPPHTIRHHSKWNLILWSDDEISGSQPGVHRMKKMYYGPGFHIGKILCGLDLVWARPHAPKIHYSICITSMGASLDFCAPRKISFQNYAPGGASQTPGWNPVTVYWRGFTECYRGSPAEKVGKDIFSQFHKFDYTKVVNGVCTPLERCIKSHETVLVD